MKREKLAEILRREYVKTILMVIITIGSVFAFWYGLRFAFKTEHPLLAVASGSMRPTLQVGDLIVVQGVFDASEIKAAPNEGDIIVFRRFGELIVHRAINKENRDGIWYLETKGDNNSVSDGWFPFESNGEQNVIGKVVGRVPSLGHIALFLEPFHVRVTFIVLWIIFLIILEFIPLARKQIKEGQSETSPE